MKRNDKRPIRMLVLSVTGDCNYACRYCYASDHDPSYMTIETAVHSLDLVRHHGQPFVVQFSGGEPLLNWPVIKAVVKAIEEEDLHGHLQIQTNGSLLTDEIAQYLYTHKVAIGISLDGKPPMNDKLRLIKIQGGNDATQQTETGACQQDGQSATMATLQGFEVLKRNGIATGITCVVSQENVDTLEDIVDFAYYLGNVRRIGFDILRGQGRGTRLVAPFEMAMEAAMDRVFKRAKQLESLFPYKIDFSQVDRARVLQKGCEKEFGHCYAMNGEAAFVDASGRIYACASFVDDEEYFIGTIANGIEESLTEAVQDRMSQAMAFCKDCADFDLCGGGCYARWFGGKSGEKEPYYSECALKRSAIAKLHEET